MKTLIREVIKLDQQAIQKIEALKKEKEEISIAFKEMKADLQAHQKLEIEVQTKQLEIDAQALFEERLTQYQQKTTIKETSILEQFEANKDQWLKDLMDFILGDVN
jgi:seryl-tRNA(Sec) selenium transferase